VVSWLSVDYWRQQGAQLCVLAREVSFEELREIRLRCPDIKLETFVHGAMCMTYSGRCLLSNYMAERGSNQGGCAHSCRWKYSLKVRHPDGSEGTLEINDSNMSEFQFFLEEEFRPGELYPIEEDERGAYILNSRDLCLMPKLDQYLALGLDSLKVEGRNKNEYYVAVVARSYRHAIDAYHEDPEGWGPGPYMSELETSRARGYTLGFHEGRPTHLAHDYDNGQSLSAFEFAGLIREWTADSLILELRNRLVAGDVLEFLPPGSLACIRLRLYEFEDAETGKRSPKLSAGQGRAVRIPLRAFHRADPDRLRHQLPEGSIVRKRSVLSTEQWQHLNANRSAQQVELGLITMEQLARSKAKPGGPRPPPKLGVDGCCGLGCNGCLMFWNEPRFANARQRLEASGEGRLVRTGTP
jgi:U32 family peptidase